MKFEWDENKNQSNLNKHKLDFTLAIEVFSDPMAIKTTRIVNGEERFQIIGEIEKCIFSVAYTIRNKNIRIISARLASKKERNTYGQKTTVGKS